ncbi:hypothetical protein BKA62DRAFT_746085 [Auriculariales sp. MPI-PUGE-AT-0066]|nr:hypothetical protein BKA62DRAFT_746085 [Auriculariales sp. MPI-PUGE-AT-0066]
MAAVVQPSFAVAPSAPYPITSSYVAHVAIQRKQNGRRKERRREDARFTGNPHIVAPSRSDYSPIEPRTTPTFPAPPPFPRSAPAPSASRPVFDAPSATAGAFRISARGVRRAVARCGPRMQALAADVEANLLRWRDAEGTFDTAQTSIFAQTNVSPDSLGITELQSAPGELRWSVPDPWTRYVVHCVARKCGIVSVSTDDSSVTGGRVTRLLRPHISRRGVREIAGLHTPQTTDHEFSDVVIVDSESEFTTSEFGESEGMSDIEETPRPLRGAAAPQALGNLTEGEESGADDAYNIMVRRNQSIAREIDVLCFTLFKAACV